MLEEKFTQVFFQKLPKEIKPNNLISVALTHTSFVNENRRLNQDNERLEFLGDAILNYIVAEWLYTHYPLEKEGFLTKLRSALVHTKKLAEFGRKIDLGSNLLLGKGEDQAGGRDKDAILCDAFEALVAAIYLSSDIQTVKAFVYPFLEKETKLIIKNHNQEDPKSSLQEWAQSRGYASPSYVLVRESGPDHAKEFTVQVIINQNVIADGSGNNKQLAEKSAAIKAIKLLEIIG